MSDLNPKAQYKEGIDRTLDRKLQEYRKIRVWQGKGVHYALTDNEVDVLAELWRKERQTPWKMTFDDVSTLMVRASLKRKINRYYVYFNPQFTNTRILKRFLEFYFFS